MQPIERTSSVLSPFIETKLESGVTICDKTNGLAKVIFLSDETDEMGRHTHQVFIKDKKLIFPTFSHPADSRVLFTGSVRFTIKHKNEFIKITEVDESSEKTVVYVDPNKCVEGIAYDAFTYIPKALTPEEALEKIKHLETEFPDLKRSVVVYNRHGVAVWGWDEKVMTHTFFWANPDEEKVKKMEAECKLYRNGTYHAKANIAVNFRCLGRGEYTLNAEPAKILEFLVDYS